MLFAAIAMSYVAIGIAATVIGWYFGVVSATAVVMAGILAGVFAAYLAVTLLAAAVGQLAAIRSELDGVKSAVAAVEVAVNEIAVAIERAAPERPWISEWDGDADRNEPPKYAQHHDDVWSGGYRDKDGVWHDFERPK